MVKLTLLVAAAASVLSTVVNADTFIGCGLVPTILTSGSVKYTIFSRESAEQCVASCAGYEYANYKPGIKCACFTRRHVADNGLACYPTNNPSRCWNNILSWGAVYKVAPSSFVLKGCTKPSRLSIANADTYNPSVIEQSQCLSKCAGYKYAITTPKLQFLKLDGYTCQCTNTPPRGSWGECSAATSFVFGNGPTVSALANLRRRELAAQEQLEREANPYCPAGLDACLVDAADQGSYECIASDFEVESCGGCRFGAFGNASAPTGTDCTSLPGVEKAAVSCINGECVAQACKKGFNLVSGHCFEA